jgi:hypothetical protein
MNTPKLKTGQPRIAVGVDGFRLVGPDGQVWHLVRWGDIDEIIAYKRDLMSVDLICAAFSTESGALELHEEQDGWEELMRVVPDHLKGARSYAEALRDVAFPAFATNKTILYRRTG